MPHVAKTCCLFKNVYTTEIKLKPCDLESNTKLTTTTKNVYSLNHSFLTSIALIELRGDISIIQLLFV